MKKKVFVWVVAAVLTFGLAGCAGRAESTSESSQSAGSESAVVEEETTSEVSEPEEATEETTGESTSSASAISAESVTEPEEEESESTSAESEEGFVSMPNPWTETTDIQEACDGSRIDFDPPVDAALPEGMSFLQYLYAENMIDALYTGEGGSMTIRVGRDVPSETVSGDYNEYSESWETSLKGLTVNCSGDGETINVATFSVDNISFAIMVNSGEEGNGITIDEVNSLVNGMQAVAL